MDGGEVPRPGELIVTSDDIFRQCQPVVVPFPMPAWGGTLEAAGLDGLAYAAADQEAKRFAGSGPTADVRRAAWWIVRCVRRPGGEPLFTDADLDRVCRLPYGVLLHVYVYVQQANGMDDELRAYLGNSEPAPSSGSPIGLAGSGASAT